MFIFKMNQNNECLTIDENSFRKFEQIFINKCTSGEKVTFLSSQMWNYDEILLLKRRIACNW